MPKEPGSEGKKGKKKKISKKSDPQDEAERKARMEEKIRRRVQCEARAFQIVEKLVEEVIDEEKLKDAVKFIDRTYYADITEERSIAKLCGYPLCPNPLTSVPQQKFHISLKTKKVYDITERKKFCSNQCYKASVHLAKVIPETPVWLREKEDQPVQIRLLPHTNNSGNAGEIIVGADPPLKRDIEILKHLDSLSNKSPRIAKNSNKSPQLETQQLEELTSKLKISEQSSAEENITQDSQKNSEILNSASQTEQVSCEKSGESGKVKDDQLQQIAAHFQVPDRLNSAGVVFSSFEFLTVGSGGDFETPKTVPEQSSKQSKMKNRRVKFSDSSEKSHMYPAQTTLVDIRDGNLTEIHSSSDLGSEIGPEESNRIRRMYQSRFNTDFQHRKSVELTSALEQKIQKRRDSLVTLPLPQIRTYGYRTVNAAKLAAHAKGGARVIFRGSLGAALRRKSVGQDDLDIFDALKSERDVLREVTGQKGELLSDLQRRFRPASSFSMETDIGDGDDSVFGDEVEESEVFYRAFHNQSAGRTFQRLRRQSVQLTHALEDKLIKRKHSLVLPDLPKVKVYGYSTVNAAQEAAKVKIGILKERLGQKKKDTEEGDSKLVDVLCDERKVLQQVSGMKEKLQSSLLKQTERLSPVTQSKETEEELDSDDDPNEQENNFVQERLDTDKKKKANIATTKLLKELLDRRDELEKKLAKAQSQDPEEPADIQVQDPSMETETLERQSHVMQHPSLQEESVIQTEGSDIQVESAENVVITDTQELPKQDDQKDFVSKEKSHIKCDNDKTVDSDGARTENTETCHVQKEDNKKVDCGSQDDDVCINEVDETHASTARSEDSGCTDMLLSSEQSPRDSQKMTEEEGSDNVATPVSNELSGVKNDQPARQSKLQKRSKVKQGPSQPNVTHMFLIQQQMCEWKTTATVSFLTGQSSNTSLDTDAWRFAGDMSSMLDEESLAENERPQGHLPPIQSLVEQTHKFDVKVKGFYSGKFSAPRTKSEKKGKKGTPEKDSEDVREPVIPYVDSHAQMAIRQKIVLDKLNHVLANLLGPLGLGVRDVSSEVRQLVSTFNLTSQNISFKPVAWNLVGFLILRLLSGKLKQLRVAFDRDYSKQFYSTMLTSVGSSEQEVDHFISFMLTPENHVTVLPQQQ